MKGAVEADGYRPVASSEVLRRVVGRAMIQVAEELIEATMLAANNLAFSKDGCLTAYSLVRHQLAAHPDWICAASDKRSAFQLKSRHEMRRQLMARLPSFVRYFDAAYGQPAGLHFQGRTIPADQAEHGCQQGCAWGTLLYSLADLEQVRSLQGRHAAVSIYAFVDDLLFVGPPAAVAAALADWEAVVLAALEQPHLGKCMLWAPTAAAGAHAAVQALVARGMVLHAPEGGMKVLGHPLGSEAFCRAFYAGKAAWTGGLVD